MKTTNSIFAFLMILLCLSCKEEGSKTNTEKVVGDSLKNYTSIQKSEISTPPKDSINTSKESQNLPPEKDMSPLLGSWEDADPADPGPSSQIISLTADGACNISEQEGGYQGSWSYDPATGILNLKLSHMNGSGVIDSEVDNDYKVEELTDNRIKLSDISGKYPMLGGYFWKNVNYD